MILSKEKHMPFLLFSHNFDLKIQTLPISLLLHYDILNCQGRIKN